MKFFVTGRSSKYGQVEKAFDLIEKQGHKVTIRWTDLPMIKPYGENQDKAGEYAEQQIEGVINADVYILLAHEDGNGIFTELGAALAMAKMRGKPQIYAVGSEETRAATMFHYHPLIKWYESVEEILAQIG